MAITDSKVSSPRADVAPPTSAPGSREWERRPRALPQDDASCAWLADVSFPPARRLVGEVRVDCAILGGGFTGLAAARRLRELRPEWTIAVIDAQRAGWGASGRSSGFVVDLVDFTARLSARDREHYVHIARSGIETLRRLVQRHRIACDWDETGWLRGAASPAGLEFLASWPKILDGFGMAYRKLDADEMTAVTGSRFYRAGVRLTGSVLVHTAKLVRGLVAALPSDVELFEDSPVQAIEKAGLYRLRTPEGTLVADRLLVTVNGYCPALGFQQRYVFPIFTFASMTRPLTESEQARLGGEREWGLLAMDTMGSTLRRTRDQRFLVRNTIHFTRGLEISSELLARARQQHRLAFDARFPTLREVEFAHSWSGLMGTSRTRLHWFGELERNLFVSAGYTGAGIAMGTATGGLLAELAAGQGSELLERQLSLPRPFHMPPDPFRSLGGWFITRRMNASAGPYL